MFIKHLAAAVLALPAIIIFEYIIPGLQKMAAKGPSPEPEKIKKEQLLAGMLPVGLAFIIMVIPAIMNYI